jgi:hypothetical protein
MVHLTPAAARRGGLAFPEALEIQFRSRNSTRMRPRACGHGTTCRIRVRLYSVRSGSPGGVVTVDGADPVHQSLSQARGRRGHAAGRPVSCLLLNMSGVVGYIPHSSGLKTSNRPACIAVGFEPVADSYQ